MKHLIAAIERRIIEIPWFYKWCLSMYFTMRVWLRPVKRLHRAVQSVTPTRQQIKIKLYHRWPHLFVYLRYGRDIYRGNVRSGVSSIIRQIVLDLHNWRVARKNGAALRKLYQEAILCCIRHRVPQWWDFFPNAKLDSIPGLQIFLRDYVLRRAGDYQEFLRLRAEVRRLFGAMPANDAFFDIVCEHFAKVVGDMDAGALTQDVTLDQTKPPFLIAVSVWGERYLNLMLNYCFPSLLSAGNLGVLCQQRQPVLYIHTDSASREMIERAEVTGRLKAMGVVIIYQMVNDTLIGYCREVSGL